MKRVLIIDDEEPSRHLLARVVARHGYEPIEAADGKEGLAKCEEMDFAGIVTDIFMPGMDGLEVIKTARARWPEMKIVAISGGGSIGNMNILHAARAMGAAHVLTKPYSIAELGEAVKSACGAPDP